MSTEKFRKNLEERLCTYFGRKYCFLTGRGSTAIYLALRSLRVQGGKVVLPTVVCPSPANVVLYAGFQPIFCDISLEDYNMSVSSLERVLAKENDVVAIIPVHLFGQPADIHAIINVAQERGLYVIEDAAQAMGGKYRGKMLGAFGDLSIVSFGHTKIIDVGWGGAVLTDNEFLAGNIREDLKAIPERPNNITNMFNEYRTVYYTLRDLTELHERLNDLFLPLPYIYKEMYLFRFPESEAQIILSHLDKLDEFIEKRQINAEEYRRRLQHPEIVHPQYHEEGVYWRYSFTLRGDNQKEVTDAMRAEGIDISNWYPPIHRWYASGKNQTSCSFENSIFLRQHIINLWVEPSVTPKSIANTCNTLLRILDTLKSS